MHPAVMQDYVRERHQRLVADAQRTRDTRGTRGPREPQPALRAVAARFRHLLSHERIAPAR